jgi:hypothetical protein
MEMGQPRNGERNDERRTNERQLPHGVACQHANTPTASPAASTSAVAALWTWPNMSKPGIRERYKMGMGLGCEHMGTYGYISVIAPT